MSQVSRTEHVTRTVLGGLAFAAVSGIIIWWWNLLPDIWNFLTAEVATSRWLFWLMAISSIALVAFIGLIIYANRNPEKPKIPTNHLVYNKDAFEGLLWQWRYDQDGMPLESSVFPTCPNDDTILLFFGGAVGWEPSGLHCETCNKNFLVGKFRYREDLHAFILRRIVDKLRKGSWKELVEENKPND